MRKKILRVQAKLCVSCFNRLGLALPRNPATCKPSIMMRVFILCTETCRERQKSEQWKTKRQKQHKQDTHLPSTEHCAARGWSWMLWQNCDSELGNPPVWTTVESWDTGTCLDLPSEEYQSWCPSFPSTKATQWCSSVPPPNCKFNWIFFKHTG